ncbi:hypothetical protein Tco_0564979 [Tanacetum coccineum]
MNTASTSCSRTLPGNTITNPKEDLKGITTRSGVAYQGPAIPSTSSSSPKVMNCDTENFVLEGLTIPRLQTIEDLEGDDLLLYDAEMELMNMILLSILNEFYNSVDACTLDKDM